MNLLKEFLRPLKKHIALILFRKKFRANNEFNEVIPENIFPMGKVKIGRHTYGYLNFMTWGETEKVWFFEILFLLPQTWCLWQAEITKWTLSVPFHSKLNF